MNKFSETSKEISIVIPVHNEEENIELLLDNIFNSMKNSVNFEVIIVNDGSSDHTEEKILNLKNKYSDISYIKHIYQSGQSSALISGVEYSKFDWILTLDGDGQNDPNDIKKFILLRDKIANDKLLLAGYRKLRQDSFYKKLQSKFANKVRAFILKDNTPDTGCGIKLFNKKLFLSFPRFNHMHRFLPALAIYFNADVQSIDVNHLPRKNGQSHYDMWGRLKVGIIDIFGILWLRKRLIIKEITKHNLDNK